ncbi:SDR family NAD(P)-dependent oxidoreductase [Croceicoccus sp. BE223]|uniref:SDR family NAD(P)-dependent oxidoreductase n=1 Tax=Croceicoccus sp. BE223 TaxID=2817716 RepID=UPI00285F4990|nr:SDR family NAD(P)-dependent oxidoreductase [Croceicoccus sp. BE223]MDR7103685.1 NAD(P)-dependent dehydrogenase (short-subunit alcohol dehydrogenase family) [Croceicoccus sp. BE223]
MGLIDGKVAIVTGSGAGLGQSYAQALAREGASVVVNDFSPEAAEGTVRGIVDAGGKAVANVADVGSIEGGESLLKSALDAFGRVDILVNNAGILRDASLVKMEESQWDAVMHVHVKALYAATKPVFTWMKENGSGGVIVNTTSTAGIRGNFGQSNYSAAKCGAIGFTNSLAIEGKKFGIRAWNIAPAAATALTAHMPDEYKKVFHIDRVAPTLLYMVSDLSGEQTGKTLMAGGGWVGECRFEVTDGFVPGEDLSAHDIAKAAEEGQIFFPDRPAKWVTAYGPQSE